VWLIFLLCPYVLGAESLVPEPASGAPTLAAEYPSDGKPPSAIGKLYVRGVGDITFLASRSQGRLVLSAVGTDGAQLGRAESVVGLGDTPIYIRSSKGLMRIVIHWKT
jgi:hypothetical protein